MLGALIAIKCDNCNTTKSDSDFCNLWLEIDNVYLYKIMCI